MGRGGEGGREVIENVYRKQLLSEAVVQKMDEITATVTAEDVKHP